MNDVFLTIGKMFCCIGGIILAVLTLFFLALLVFEAWIHVSCKFRDVLSGESLIQEYKKNRQEYLYWKSEKESKKEE